MPRFDFGGNDGSSSVQPNEIGVIARRLTVSWVEESQEKTLLLLPQAVAEAGRLSSRDLCLRVEPATEPANYEKSKAISKHHFSLRYLGNVVQFIDVGSVGGCIIDGKTVQANSPLALDRKVGLSVADVLNLELEPVARNEGPAESNGLFRDAAAHVSDRSWLQEQLVGEDKAGRVAFLRISRKSNLPNQQYILLFHAGLIGSGEDSLLRIPNSELAPRRKRAFDIGGPAAADPARLFVRDGAVWIERTGADDVSLNGEPLEAGEQKVLQAGQIIIGKTTFTLSME